jgi:hypothetical protein
VLEICGSSLLDQRLPRLTVRRERFGLSAGAVEGEHELGTEVLGMLRDQDPRAPPTRLNPQMARVRTI